MSEMGRERSDLLIKARSKFKMSQREGKGFNWIEVLIETEVGDCGRTRERESATKGGMIDQVSERGGG